MITILSYALLADAIAYALLRGGLPEKLFAAIFASSFLIDRLVHALIGSDDERAIAYLHLSLDGVSLLAMLAVAIPARRLWTLWALACQTLSVLSDLTYFVEAELPAFAPIVVSFLPSYVKNVSLILGTWFHRRRLHYSMETHIGYSMRGFQEMRDSRTRK